MKTTTPSHLYLLRHREHPIFKIGIANCVHGRIKAIGHDIDKRQSLFSKGTRAACVDAEKAMHHAMRDYRLPGIGGNGGTEWFDAEGFDAAVKAFDVVRESTGMSALQPVPEDEKSPDLEKLMRVSFEVTRDQRRKLKMHAAKAGKPIADILREFVVQL